MSKQVLVINVTRMGDLVQMGGLLARLQAEWPGAAVDLVVDRRFAPVASMLPGLRHIITYDFHGLIDETRARVKDVVSAYRAMAAWVKPLRDAGYDRIVNVTFDKRSGLLTSYIGAPDIRGVTCAQDGTAIVKNPWLSYFTDCHAYRRFNRFNLVDLYALGGSGLGPAKPLSLSVPKEATEWARTFLHAQSPGRRFLVAVQVGASDVMKAWRPDYFGQTLALISRQADAGLVLIGTAEESASAEQARRAYQAAAGRAPWCDAIGRTTVEQLTALLAECRLLLTNDTGPMHLAVGVGTPVIDVSVGHVNFWETGPYGPGHWVIQPNLECAPCGFDRVCPHHACKDHVQCADVASLCRHVLGVGPLPERAGAIRVYESGIDEDGLGTFNLRIGRADQLTEWYGRFWRQFWYEALAKRPSSAKHPLGPPPDRRVAEKAFGELEPLLTKLVERSEQIDRLCRRQPPPVTELRDAHLALQRQQQSLVASALTIPSLLPITVAFLREVHNNDAAGLAQMSAHQLRAYRVWRERVAEVRRRLQAASNESDASTLIMPAAQAPAANTVSPGVTL